MSARESARHTGEATVTHRPKVCPQPSLFDPPPATYSQGTYPGARPIATSRDAARSIAAELGDRHAEVIRALEVLGPSTPDEIAAWIGRPAYTVRPRVTELCSPQQRKLIRLTETRPTPSGRSAHVVRLADRGQHAGQDVTESVHGSTLHADAA